MEDIAAATLDDVSDVLRAPGTRPTTPCSRSPATSSPTRRARAGRALVRRDPVRAAPAPRVERRSRRSERRASRHGCATASSFRASTSPSASSRSGAPAGGPRSLAASLARRRQVEPALRRPGRRTASSRRTSGRLRLPDRGARHLRQSVATARPGVELAALEAPASRAPRPPRRRARRPLAGLGGRGRARASAPSRPDFDPLGAPVGRPSRRSLSQYATFFGDPARAMREADEVAAVDADAGPRFAAARLRIAPGRDADVDPLPEGAPDLARPVRPPRPGPPGCRPMPRRFERTTIAGGLTSSLSPRVTSVPLVDLELLLPAGGDRNPPDRPGLSQLTASLLDEGTAHRAGPEIAAELERRGGRSAPRATGTPPRFGSRCRRRSSISRSRSSPSSCSSRRFPERELERLRRQRSRRDRAASRRAGGSRRGGVRPRALRRHRYGELLLGTAASLAAITRAEIDEFHRDHYQPRRRDASSRGRLRRPSIARRPQPDSSRRRPGSAPAPDPDRDRRRFAAASGSWSSTVRGAAQTELRVGQVGLARTDPTATALGFLNTLLGGKFTSRINLNLRERLGITYGAYSRFVDRRIPRPVPGFLRAVNDAAGARRASEILGELSRLREELVPPVEIEETRSYLLGVFPYGLQTVEGLAARLRDIALYDLPLDHTDRVLEAYGRSTPASSRGSRGPPRAASRRSSSPPVRRQRSPASSRRSDSGSCVRNAAPARPAPERSERGSRSCDLRRRPARRASGSMFHRPAPSTSTERVGFPAADT